MKTAKTALYSAQVEDSPLTANDVAEILAHVPSRPNYDTWTRIVSAVGSALPEHEAADVLRAWSPEERPGEYLQKLRHRLARVGIGSLIQIAQENGFDAAAFHRARRQPGFLPRRRVLSPAPTPPPPPPAPLVLKAMPAADAAVYQEGIDYLRNNPAACAEIDTWRGYRSGTTATLVDSREVSMPRIYGKRCHAFVVSTADGVEIGFHVRHPAKPGERAPWTYRPTGTPALPFVLGGGCVRFAQRVVVTEGQWDALAIASALGLLVTDSSWDCGMILFGVRGAPNWRPVIEHWMPRIATSAEWHLFRDGDVHGEAWHKFAGQLLAAGRTVDLRRPSAGKDVNDVLRNRSVSHKELFA